MEGRYLSSSWRKCKLARLVAHLCKAYRKRFGYTWSPTDCTVRALSLSPSSRGLGRLKCLKILRAQNWGWGVSAFTVLLHQSVKTPREEPVSSQIIWQLALYSRNSSSPASSPALTQLMPLSLWLLHQH